MSNRARRRWLRASRLKALATVRERVPDTIESLEDWNRWRWMAFKSRWREPLRFPDNNRPDPGLINIQIRNQPGQYHPLRDAIPKRPKHLKECGNTTDPLFLWQQAEEAISGALDCLESARRVFAPRFDWMGWADARAHPTHPNRPRDRQDPDPAADWVDFFEDYPAGFYRAFRRLVPGMMFVHQYVEQRIPGYRDYGEATRNVPGIDCGKEKISEAQLYALLTLATCWWALDALQDLPEEPEQWPRWHLDYIAGLNHDVERWLAEAYRLEQAAADSHKAHSVKGGGRPKKSTGIGKLADALREERPGSSARALFDLAIASCATDGAIEVDGYRITATADGKLLSKTAAGTPDKQPVDFDAWRKNYLGRKR